MFEFRHCERSEAIQYLEGSWIASLHSRLAMTVKDRYNDGPSSAVNTKMSPKEIVKAWIDAFNRADAHALGRLYAENAINHQVAEGAVEGRAAIEATFEAEFARARMICIPDNLFEIGDWAILEWSDPLGLRGCGFFHIVEDRIARLIAKIGKDDGIIHP